jgi:hypothetical protein
LGDGFHVPQGLSGSDMKIVPVGSSGKTWGYFWFLEMMHDNRPLGDIFYQDHGLLNCTNEAKSWNHE